MEKDFEKVNNEIKITAGPLGDLHIVSILHHQTQHRIGRERECIRNTWNMSNQLGIRLTSVVWLLLLQQCVLSEYHGTYVAELDV